MRTPTSFPAPWITFFSQIGILYSQILLLLVILGVLVFHYAWGYDHRSYGLFVHLYTSHSPKTQSESCAEAWVVEVDSKQHWLLNEREIAPAELPELLSQQFGDRSSCTVYFDADPAVPYAVAIHAIEMVEETNGKLVLLTPDTKKVRIP